MQVLSSAWQTFGLFVINMVARQSPVQPRVISYGTGERERMDWYELNPAAPTVIFIYGGNWRSGKRREFRFVADTLMGMGCNVLVPDFPLYPTARFAAILNGAVDGVNHFLDEVHQTGPVILMGHSSGAQMAALMALNTELLNAGHKVEAMIGLSGPYDFYPFSEDDHWDLFSPEDHYPQSQPVNYVRGDAPELYLLHGEDDTRVRRGHSKSLMLKQQEAGGRASREVYPGMGHIDAVVSFSRLHRRNNQLIRDIQSFIQTRFIESSEGENCGTK